MVSFQTDSNHLALKKSIFVNRCSVMFYPMWQDKITYCLMFYFSSLNIIKLKKSNGVFSPTTLSSCTKAQNKLRKDNNKQKHKCWALELGFTSVAKQNKRVESLFLSAEFSQPFNSDNIKHYNNWDCLTSNSKVGNKELDLIWPFI